MRLSSLADYAVVMMSAAARHCGGIARLNATLLAEETGVPLPTVQKLVSRLSAAGLIESTRGTGGGFRLSRPPAMISLADIIEAVEGPIALTSCVDGASQDCCVEQTCKVKPHWNAVNAIGPSTASMMSASEIDAGGRDRRNPPPVPRVLSISPAADNRLTSFCTVGSGTPVSSLSSVAFSRAIPPQ